MLTPRRVRDDDIKMDVKINTAVASICDSFGSQEHCPLSVYLTTLSTAEIIQLNTGCILLILLALHKISHTFEELSL